MSTPRPDGDGPEGWIIMLILAVIICVPLIIYYWPEDL